MEQFNCVFLNRESDEKIFACLELRDDKNISLRGISSASERGWQELSGTYVIGEGETFQGKGDYSKSDEGSIIFELNFNKKPFSKNAFASFGSFLLRSENDGSSLEEFSAEIWSLNAGNEKSGVIECLLKEVSNLSDELDVLRKSSDSLSEKIEGSEVSVDKIEENSKELSETQGRLLEDISSFQKTKEDCEDLFKKWQEKEKVLLRILDENEETKEKLREISSQAENTNQQAKDALEITTTMSLARAFKTRKDEAKASAKIFSWAFYGSAGLAILIVLGQFVFLELHSDNEINPLNAWLGKVPVLVFLFWVVQFSSKKSSQQHSIMEFYAQKQALAESYQGYKDQIKEFNGADSELEKLMTINLESVGKDSSTVMEQSNREKHSPLFELIELLLIRKGVKKNVPDKSAVKKDTSQRNDKENEETP